MMKRLGVIINVIVLSALVILAGAGITLVRCSHTGTMSVAQFAVADNAVMMQSCDNTDGVEECCGMDEADHCCHDCGDTIDELPCMDYKLIKPQPIDSSNGFAFDFQPLCTLVPDFLGVAVRELPGVAAEFLRMPSGGRHGPPRAYLRLITVLLI